MIEPLGALDDNDEGTCYQPSQGEMLSTAIQLADAGAPQDEIIASLRMRFPGGSNNCYQNPSAEAVMRRIVRERARKLAREVDVRRLRAKGLPESLADRHSPAAALGQPAPGVDVPGVYD